MLTTKPTSGEELQSERLKAKLGAALIRRDLLEEKIAILEKDDDGIWRSKDQKKGSFADVWVDYKGNAGETK